MAIRPATAQSLLTGVCASSHNRSTSPYAPARPMTTAAAARTVVEDRTDADADANAAADAAAAADERDR